MCVCAEKDKFCGILPCVKIHKTALEIANNLTQMSVGRSQTCETAFSGNERRKITNTKLCMLRMSADRSQSCERSANPHMKTMWLYTWYPIDTAFIKIHKHTTARRALLLNTLKGWCNNYVFPLGGQFAKWPEAKNHSPTPFWLCQQIFAPPF